MTLHPLDIARIEKATLKELTNSLQLAVDHAWSIIESCDPSVDDIPDLDALAFATEALVYKLKKTA